MSDGVQTESSSRGTGADVDAGGAVAVLACPIAGALKLAFHQFDDDRGVIAEVYRADWGALMPAMQNFTLQRSVANVLRGMRLHRRRDEVVIGGIGVTQIGMIDLRPASPTHLVADVIEIADGPIAGVFVPAGVLHGVYSVTATVHVEARSALWDPEDEHGCIWDSPGLNIPWILPNPLVRKRERDDAGFAALVAMMNGCG
jgi:dTDP-4-dehydrorhamnose 3,5-epimerase